MKTVLLLMLATVPAVAGDWNPKLAADYLDSRQKEWFAWKVAARPDGPCFSCHTGMTYLFARPRLRTALGESKPGSYEEGLLSGLRARLVKTDAKESSSKEEGDSQAQGVESVLAALFLSQAEAGNKTLSPDAERAFDRMWSLQIRSGESKGAWAWFSLDRDPWEMPNSSFYGATLAALATGRATGGYAKRPAIQERVDALKSYLCAAQNAQPLHNRLMLLWASTSLPGLVAEPAQRTLIAETLGKQQADGGWTIESLGPWTAHAGAPPANGSDAYATALAAFVLEEAGVSHGDVKLRRALDWLKSHQDRQFGYWTSTSMNKVYEPSSMQVRFMQDAATGFATLALLEADRRE